MNESLASDLSPAQALISGITCVQCQTQIVISLFHDALCWCERLKAEGDWKWKRALALLSPMYTEVMVELHPQRSLRELLLVIEYGLVPWKESPEIPLERCSCPRVHLPVQFDNALDDLITLLMEVTSG